jgi:voltage-gated potassium channel
MRAGCSSGFGHYNFLPAARRRPPIMQHHRVTPYELFSLALSLTALAVLGATVFTAPQEETRRLLDAADLMLCGFFFIDFLRNLVIAPDKLRYLYTWGWIDLAASIPAIDALRLGRVGRVVRVLRLLRVIKASRMLYYLLMHRRRESAAWGAGFVTLLVVFSSSVAMLQFEPRAGGNITSAEDAVWWSITTITTVGYGDHYPVTTEGRLVAVGLMAVGVGLFGTLSGMAASWFTAPARELVDPPERREAEQ